MLLHSRRYKSSASVGHCPFIPLVKEMEFTSYFPEMLQWDKQLQGNGCVDRYPAFKEHHLGCDLYLKDTIINVSSLLVFLSVVFLAVPPRMRHTWRAILWKCARYL